MNLLHIDSSVQGDGSASRQLSAAVVDRLTELDPAIAVSRRDLAADPLPHLTLDRLASEDSAAVLDEFLAADVIVIGAPMYNFGIPSQLKAWFDHVLIAGRTFRYGANGPEGLAGGKRAVVVATRGGLYGEESPGAANEHAESHLKAMLGFMGIEPEIIVVEGIAFGPEQRNAALASALEAIREIAPAALATAA